MFWKYLSLILIIILICFILSPYYHKLFGDNKDSGSYSVIIRNNTIFNYINEYIIEVYRVLSSINQSIRYVFPVTQNLSHWQVIVKTNNEHYIMLSSSPAHYIEVYETFYIENKNIFISKFRDETYLGWSVNKYTTKDIKRKNVTVRDLIIETSNYYNDCIKRYFITKNNCHTMVIYILKNIFGIDCDKDVKRNYSFSNIYKEFMSNKRFLVHYNNLIV